MDHFDIENVTAHPSGIKRSRFTSDKVEMEGGRAIDV
jgi:hypothetical protein